MKRSPTPTTLGPLALLLLAASLATPLAVSLAGCGQRESPYGSRPSAPSHTPVERAAVEALRARINERADALDGPFLRAVRGIEAWPEAPTGPEAAPCPHDLPVPSEQMTEGETPGEAALRAGLSEERETPIGRVPASGGAPEASAAAASLRSWARNLTYPGWQLERLGPAVERRLGEPAGVEVLYRTTRFQEPEVDEQTQSFESGVSEGTAYLFNHATGRFECAAAVRAQNGPRLRSDLRSARTWLGLQLVMAEQRSIGLGMRALPEPLGAPAEPAPAEPAPTEQNSE